MSPEIARAGAWFLSSGIQEPSGGVARYYHTDLERNAGVSTEITGYTASALTCLYALTGDRRYLDRAAAAGRFLCGAWDDACGALPFELAEPAFAYFFDCGIVVRGLIAVWRATGDVRLIETAAAIGRHMANDYASSDGFHPVLALPRKEPLARDPLRWSRSSGCYQLKSAMAWLDLAKATGQSCFRELYEDVLDESLRTYASFLPGHPDRPRVMDRLHPFLYFLEGLLPVAHRPGCCAALDDGMARVAALLREIAPEFERSDVYAQLLRVRIFAARLGLGPVDRHAAAWEAAQLAEFQAPDGGFCFGRLGGEWLPYHNPVSTAFALQALALWNGAAASLPDLI